MSKPTSSASAGHVSVAAKSPNKIFEKIRQAFALFNSEHRTLRNSIGALVGFYLATELSFYISVYAFGIVECMAKPDLAKIIGFQILFCVVGGMAIVGFLGYHLARLIGNFAVDLYELFAESNN